MSVHPNGPLWFRGFAVWTEEGTETQVPILMEALGAAPIVVGHTPQPTARTRMLAQGRVFLIDTGILGGEAYPGGEPSALEIHGGRFTALYLDREEVLLDTSLADRASFALAPVTAFSVTC